MKVEVHELTSVERRIDVEVEVERVEQELGRAYAALGKRVKVAGFRAGKIPRRILEQHYRADVESDAAQRLINRSLMEALTEHEIEALGRPQVDPPKLDPTKPFRYSATVEVRPKIKPKNYLGLEIEAQDTTVSDADVAERIASLCKERATRERITDRTEVLAGDLLTADLEVTISGERSDVYSGPARSIIASEGSLASGNIAGLVGAKVGEASTVSGVPLEPVGSDGSEVMAHVLATPRELFAEKIPIADDAFATSIGADSLADLQAKVRTRLQHEKESAAKRKDDQALQEQLVAANPFEVPRALVAHHQELQLRRTLESMAQAGIAVNDLKFDWKKLAQEMEPSATLQAKREIILEAIADAEIITVSDKDLDAELKSLAEGSGQRFEQWRARLEGPQIEGLRTSIRRDRALKFVRERAKVRSLR